MRDESRWRRYWRYLGSRLRPGVEDELSFHIEMRTRELIAAGLEPADAAREAERRFGDRRRFRNQLERIERKRGYRLRLAFFLEELWQDVRYGVRGLRKRPGFALAASTSLALGIGATTTVLSIIDPILFRALDVPEANRIVAIGAQATAMPAVGPLISLPTVADIGEQTDLFSDLAAARMEAGAVRRPNAPEPERRLYYFVTGRFFPLFRVNPVAGRLLEPNDDLAQQPVAVLGHRYWTTEFRADPGAVGRSMAVNGVPLTIVGVAPPGFQGVDHIIRPDFFVPAGLEPLLTSTRAAIRTCRTCTSYGVVARLAPGRRIAEARARLETLARRLVSQYPELGEGYTLKVFTERQAHMTISSAPFIGPAGAIFLALAGLVLLAACVNTTNLVLIRASSRRAELVLRLALGASRGRVARQLLTENVVLGLFGLAGGYLVAALGAGWFNRLPLPADMPVAFSATIDGRIFGLAVAISLLASLVAGIAPAMLGSRGNVQHRLKDGARGSVGRGGDRLRAALVVGQVAASLVVLVFAGLFTTSVRRAGLVDLGFAADRVLKIQVDASLARYDEPTARRAFDRVEQEVRRVPGVRAVAWTGGVPLTSSPGSMVNLRPDDPSALGSKSGVLSAWATPVGPEYFTAMGIPLLEGRAFRPGDDTTGALVAIVNQRVAELLWPGRSPVGRSFRLSPGGAPITVVGVAKTGRYFIIGESPKPYVYQPFAQAFQSYAFLTIGTDGDPASAIGAVKAAFRTADQNLIPVGAEPMRRVVNDGFNGLMLPRLGAVAASAIGVMAVLLTIVGLYGVIAYSVAQRTQEIGVRIALGAAPAAVVRSVLRQGAFLAAAGILLGLGVAIGFTRAATGMLVEVAATDLRVFGSVVAALVAITLGSALIPARRAARLDPVRALRAE